MVKRFLFPCLCLASLVPLVLYVFVSFCLGFLALNAPEAKADIHETTIKAARLGKWPNKTRLVFEGQDGIDAKIRPGSNSTSIELQLTFPKSHNAYRWLNHVIPDNHHAIKSFDYDRISSTVTNVRFHFHRPTVVDIFKLRAMEGFSPRLVIDFYEASFVLEELWLDVTINNQYQHGTVLALAFGDNDILIEGNELKKWRVNLPAYNYIDYYGAKYYSLRDVGYDFELDRSKLQLTVDIPSTKFREMNLQANQYTPVKLTETEPGFFLNYDLTGTQNEVSTTNAGLIELGIFNSLGSLKQTSIHRYDEATSEIETTRLDTVWQTDFPDSMSSFYMGDFLTQSADWNRDLRIAGLKWETNFSTQPERIKVPTLAFSGIAGEPSTVDLYINDALRFRREVPPGPFNINELPTITGYGDVQMVITDILGRQHVLQQSYFTDRRMLREGLHDYSYAVGTLRENYGLSHADYSGWLFNAYHRYGVSDQFTFEWSGRFNEFHQLVGLGSIHVLPWNNSISYSVAASNTEDGEGQLVQLGFQHQRREFNFGVEAQQSFNYFQISDVQLQTPYPELQVKSYMSWSPSGVGSFRLGYTEQRYQDDSVAFVNAGISTQIGNFAYLSLQALKFLDDAQEYQINASISIPLGGRSSLSTGGTRYPDSDRAYAQIQRQAPSGTGVGLRLRQGLLEDTSRQADLLLKTAIGNYQFNYQANEYDDGYDEAYRASISGSVSYIDGYMTLGQPVHDSFGLVSLPDYPNVRIYADNQHIATTDGDGDAFIPRLRAYQRNRIRLEHADLPMSANIESLEQEVAPYYRSGVVIEFPVSQSLNASMNVITANGDYVPVAAQATNLTNGEETMIGYDGVLYLVGLSANNDILIEWDDNGKQQECRVNFKLPNKPNVLHDLGKVICQ